MYTVGEGDGNANPVIIKEGRIAQAIDLNFVTIDGTAISVGMFLHKDLCRSCDLEMLMSLNTDQILQ